jgi:hypothetical protein
MRVIRLTASGASGHLKFYRVQIIKICIIITGYFFQQLVMTFRLNRLSKGSCSIKWDVFSLILRNFLLGFIISGSEARVNINLGG